jgi:peptide/nickel transport system substrate-binding protein
LKPRNLLSLLVLVTMLLGAVACQTAKPPVTNDPKTPKDLIIGLDADPPSLDSYATSNAQGHNVLSLILERLIKKDAAGNYIPWLATKWELVSDTKMTFTLRDDVYFSDGTKFTPEDAVFSLQAAATSSFTRNLFGAIDVENTKVTGPNTIEVNLLRPDASLFEALSSIRGVMLSKAHYESLSPEERGRNPLGTGPMKLDNWVAGDRLELVHNEHYWGEKPKFNKAVFRVIVEAATRAIDLETGGVDIALSLSPTDWDRIDKGANTKLVSGMTQGVWFITFNSEIPPFDNILVRKAIAHAINLEAMVAAAWQGVGVPATSHIPATVFGHKAIGPWEYNPEKARQLLAEAGYPNGLQITFQTYEQSLYLAIAETAQEMLREVGIEVKIDVTDLATYTNMNNEGKIPFSVMNTQAVIPDPTAALLVWPTHRTISIRHNDTHIDDLMEAGASTYDQAERERIYHELLDYLWEKLYTLPVGYAQRADGVRKNVQGFEFAPNVMNIDLTKVSFTN